jgi:hypothetical protein
MVDGEVVYDLDVLVLDSTFPNADEDRIASETGIILADIRTIYEDNEDKFGFNLGSTSRGNFVKDKLNQDVIGWHCTMSFHVENPQNPFETALSPAELDAARTILKPIQEYTNAELQEMLTDAQLEGIGQKPLSAYTLDELMLGLSADQLARLQMTGSATEEEVIEGVAGGGLFLNPYLSKISVHTHAENAGYNTSITSLPEWISGIFTSGKSVIKSVLDTLIGKVDQKVDKLEGHSLVSDVKISKIDGIPTTASELAIVNYSDLTGNVQSAIQQIRDILTSMDGGVAVGGDSLLKLYTLITANQSNISTIQAALASDNTLLDTFQEIVDFIETNKLDLDNYVSALNNKVEKVVGKDLIETSKITKLDSIENGATSDQSASEIATLYHSIHHEFTTLLKAKLEGIATGATKNESDTFLLNRANHTGLQEISTVSGLQSALESRSLEGHTHSSDELTEGTAKLLLTPSERAKLASLDTRNGAPVQSTTELIAIPYTELSDKEKRFVEDTGNDFYYDAQAIEGSFEPTDKPVGATGWWIQIVTGGTETAASIKSKYESNSNTNAYTDSEKTKLAGISAGAQVNDGAATIKTKYESNADTNAYTDAEKEKLYWIESGAQVNRTNAQLKTDYESNLDTNAYTDAEKSKLLGIQSGAQVNQTAAEIKTAYESNVNTNEFSDAEKEKLGAIESGAQVNRTAAQLKTDYESNFDTNAFTDTEKTKLSGISAGATQNQTDAHLLSRGNHTGVQAISTITNLQSLLDSKEAVIVKQSGFNLALGTTAGTVSEGNHKHNSDELTEGTSKLLLTPSERAKLASLDTRNGAPVQDTAELTAISFTDLADKEKRFVENEGTDFYFDMQATEGDFVPTDKPSGSTGFWIRIQIGSSETAASIKTKYESNADTNAYTDAEKTKLSNIEVGATSDMTAEEISIAYHTLNNEYTDTEKTKLSGIEANATSDMSAAEIATAYHSLHNQFTNTHKSAVEGLSTTYLGIGATATDSSKLGGKAATEYWDKNTALLEVKANDTVNEGGEIKLWGGGTNNAWHMDVFGVNLRFFGGTGEILLRGNKLWHQGNDGADSGLDADLLDGKNGSEYSLKTDWGIYAAAGRDFYAHGKRAMVAFNTTDGDQLVVNFEGDFANGVKIDSQLQVTGNVTAPDFVMTSDARLKDNVRTIENASEIVNTLNPVRHTWIDDSTKKDNFGFLAQEVEKIAPEVVHYDEISDTYGVAYQKLVPVLVKTIQDLTKRIEELEKRTDK